MPRGAIVWAALLLLGTEQQSFADPDAQGRAEAHKTLGQAAYADGKFEECARQFAASHALVPDAGMLFNVGLCYQNAEQWQASLDAFTAYVKLAPDGPRVGEATTRIEFLELKVQAEARQQPVVTEPPPKQVVATPQTAAPVEVAPARVAAAAQYDPMGRAGFRLAVARGPTWVLSEGGIYFDSLIIAVSRKFLVADALAVEPTVRMGGGSAPAGEFPRAGLFALGAGVGGRWHVHPRFDATGYAGVDFRGLDVELSPDIDDSSAVDGFVGTLGVGGEVRIWRGLSATLQALFSTPLDGEHPVVGLHYGLGVHL